MSGTWESRLLTLCSLLALVGSVALQGGRGLAAGQPTSMSAPMHVRLCTSLPFAAPGARGIYNSVTLATEQWKLRFREAHMNLLPPVKLDDTNKARQSYDVALEAANAHSCIRRSDVFGYVGPLNSGAALRSEPILNRAAMLQINPATTNAVLTSPLTRKSLEPATYSHRLAYPTFYRVVTTDLLQGPADAAFMRERLHARTYLLVEEPFDYARGIAGGVQVYATRIGLHLVGTAHIQDNSPSSMARSARAVAGNQWCDYI